MANLKDLQKQAEEELQAEEAQMETFEPVSLEEEQNTGAPIGASIWDEIQESADFLPNNQTLCALVGGEGAGKTGVVLDSLTDEEIMTMTTLIGTFESNLKHNKLLSCHKIINCVIRNLVN